MIAVSDTTALHYLILIGHAEILPEVFGTVAIPLAEVAEISGRERRKLFEFESLAAAVA